MPRSAATIFGLILVAISIGFNTMRYPVVWEMVGPARASEPTQPAASAQSENAASAQQPQQSAPPLSLLTTPIEVKPAAEATDSVGSGESPTSDAGTAGDAGTAAGQEAATGEVETPKPLVPVTAARSSGLGVRRLPAVTGNQNVATGENRDSTVFYNGSIPIYPTTGIE